MDVLADRLRRGRARGTVFALSTLQPPWGMRLADDGPLSLHAVLAGEVWLTPPDGMGLAPVRLLQDDVALLRADGEYRLADSPGTPCVPLGEIPGRREGEVVVQTVGSPPRPGAAASVLLCGAFHFDGDVCDGLLAALPPVVRVAGGNGSHGTAADAASIRAAIALLTDEVARNAPGQRAVLDRLLDLLLVFTLRSWLAGAEHAPAWYRALGDPAVGQALRLLHAQCGRRWTVAALAAESGLSRAALARRFSALVGQTPMGYLAEWRMTVAAGLLRDTDRTIASIAREVGYDNEFAFSSAFRRLRGSAPGRYRRVAAGVRPATTRREASRARRELAPAGVRAGLAVRQPDDRPEHVRPRSATTTGLSSSSATSGRSSARQETRATTSSSAATSTGRAPRCPKSFGAARTERIRSCTSPVVNGGMRWA